MEEGYSRFSNQCFATKTQENQIAGSNVDGEPNLRIKNASNQ
ncbi:hypothetical protein M514_24787, partial [Trichuris suis]